MKSKLMCKTYLIMRTDDIFPSAAGPEVETTVGPSLFQLHSQKYSSHVFSYLELINIPQRTSWRESAREGAGPSRRQNVFEL